MAIYEYYCPTCREKFEERRPMSEASAPAKCREGHVSQRTISTFAAPRGGVDLMEMDAGGGGGCCGGGGCACAAGMN
ncbi:MAG: zinc ribbon domain-containing protein [Dehalococcoidia bacterium]|nr:zinc ribbon domain-containing protein [Dehalococcoidia bacterium]